MRLTALGVLFTMVFGQEVEDYTPLYHSPNLRLRWNKNTETRIIKAQIVFCQKPEDISDPQKWVLTLEITEDANLPSPEVRLRPTVDSLADGTYYVFVRQQSEFDVWSDWSEPLKVLKVWRKPEAPGGCALFR